MSSNLDSVGAGLLAFSGHGGVQVINDALGSLTGVVEQFQVADLELSLLLGEAKVLLKNNDAEHEDRFERGDAILVLAVPVAEDFE